MFDLPPRVLHLHRKINARKAMEVTMALELKEGFGIIGDASFGRSKRQILLVSHAVLSRLDLIPGEIRENIVIDKLDVDALPAGAILSIGSASMEVTGPCDPCARMDEIRDGLQNELKGSRGILAKVIKSGRILVDDEVVVSLPMD